MEDIEGATSQFACERPDLVPVLRAMVDLARENEARPESRLGEFCRDWLAAGEPGTPRTPGVFADVGLIRKSPRGPGVAGTSTCAHGRMDYRAVPTRRADGQRFQRS